MKLNLLISGHIKNGVVSLALSPGPFLVLRITLLPSAALDVLHHQQHSLLQHWIYYLQVIHPMLQKEVAWFLRLHVYPTPSFSIFHTEKWPGGPVDK